jgi:predicted dehydrogenase
MTKNLWLIGAGQMSVDYANVLRALGQPFEVIGRGENSAATFESKVPVKVTRGGVDRALENGKAPELAVVAVQVQELAPLTRKLIQAGTKKILLEKPAGLNFKEVEELGRFVAESGAQVFVAYNRRFYSSVLEARRRVADEGGVLSFCFEFTEWSHVIEKIADEIAKKEWFFANSTHVIDMAFFLGGTPKRLASFSAGGLKWHPTASVFSGAGESRSGALFSYHADWEGPGRWWVELVTRKNRYIFRPLEKLQVQALGSVAIQECEIDDRLDKEFKPGLYRQAEEFLQRGDALLSLDKHVLNLETYKRILHGEGDGSK